MNTQLPAFSDIKAENIQSSLEQILNENRARLTAVLAAKPTTWQDLIAPLETLDNHLHKFWSPVSHLHAVVSTEELRNAYNACLPLLSAYSTEIEQNTALYQAIHDLKTTSFKQLDAAQQKVIDDSLRDFHLSGVDLPPAQKQRYAEIQSQLASLTSKFEEHILDATEHWFKHIENLEDLAGLPDYALEMAKAAATTKKLTGWVLTLEQPAYIAVLTYAKNRKLREELYTAYQTRASELGPDAGKYDNSPVMVELLKLKQELSKLLGFNNYAELSLATKMVKKPQDVLNFLRDLAKQIRPTAAIELKQLAEFAALDGIEQLQPWDMTYYREKLSEQLFGISDEILRPYFPEPTVLAGLFNFVNKLYGIQITEVKNANIWHPDVRLFEIRDQQNTLRAYFYLDLYARARKRGGAWMDEYCSRWREMNGDLQLPVAYLTCNLTPASDNKPALFTHDEVLTLFHEFGHGLHHMLTQINYLDISGINGVEWDAVELPSQFMEYFVWEKSVLDLISGHWQTGEKLPQDLITRLQASKDFQAGLHFLRQIEFALFDFLLHLNADSISKEQIQHTLDEVRKEINVYQPPAWNRFQNSFSHIFAGGYSAGYYSYLWAEVLACDAFLKFKLHDTINFAVGKEFLTNILENGGSAPASELYIRFRGRLPEGKSLLEYYGLAK